MGAKTQSAPQHREAALSLSAALLRSDRLAGGEAAGTTMTGEGVSEQEVLMVLMSVAIQITVPSSLQLLRHRMGDTGQADVPEGQDRDSSLPAPGQHRTEHANPARSSHLKKA